MEQDRIGNLSHSLPLSPRRRIAEEFTKVYRRPSRTKIGAAFALMATLLIGAYGASGTLASSTSAHRHPARAHLLHPAPHPRNHR